MFEQSSCHNRSRGMIATGSAGAGTYFTGEIGDCRRWIGAQQRPRRAEESGQYLIRARQAMELIT
jgi:hypothetical protein